MFLVPPAWILTRAFFSCFSTAALQHRFWASEEFWFFSLGTLLWVVTFFGLPRPMLLYVFGHELTHVIWVWLMGGRVSQFRISRTGGYIVTDTTNFWIALAPYFFPDLQYSRPIAIRRHRRVRGCGTVPALAIWGGRVHMGFPCHLRDLDVVEGPDRSDRARDILFDDDHLSHQFFGAEPDAHRGQPGCYFSFFRKRTAPRRDGVFRPVPAFCAPQMK